MRVIGVWGHPLKGMSREKTPLPEKNAVNFFLDLYSQQRDIVSVLFRTRYFVLIGSPVSTC